MIDDIEHRALAAATRAMDLRDGIARGMVAIVPVEFDGESRLALAVVERLPIGDGWRTYPLALLLEDGDIGRLESAAGDGPMQGHWTSRGLFDEPEPWGPN